MCVCVRLSCETSFCKNIRHRSDDVKLHARSQQTLPSIEMQKGAAFWSEASRRRDSRHYPHCSPALSGLLLCTRSERRVWKLWILCSNCMHTIGLRFRSLSKCHLILAPAHLWLARLHVWVSVWFQIIDDLSVKCSNKRKNKNCFQLPLVAVLVYLVAWVCSISKYFLLLFFSKVFLIFIFLMYAPGTL